MGPLRLAFSYTDEQSRPGRTPEFEVDVVRWTFWRSTPRKWPTDWAREYRLP